MDGCIGWIELHKASVLTARSRSTGGSVGLTAPRMSGRFVTRQRNTIVQRNFTVGPSMGARSTLRSRRQMAIGSGQQFSSTPQVGSMGRSFGTVPRFAMSTWVRHSLRRRGSPRGMFPWRARIKASDGADVARFPFMQLSLPRIQDGLDARSWLVDSLLREAHCKIHGAVFFRLHRHSTANSQSSPRRLGR